MYVCIYILFHYSLSLDVKYSSLYSRTLSFIPPIHNSLHLLTPNSQSSLPNPQILIVCWHMIPSHEQPEVWLPAIQGEGLDRNSCGQFTTEGIPSLVITGNCKNKGWLGFLAHRLYMRMLAKQRLAGTTITYSHEDCLLSLRAPF